MTRFARSRSVVLATLSAGLLTLTSVITVLANSTTGPFPK